MLWEEIVESLVICLCFATNVGLSWFFISKFTCKYSVIDKNLQICIFIAFGCNIFGPCMLLLIGLDEISPKIGCNGVVYINVITCTICKYSIYLVFVEKILTTLQDSFLHVNKAMFWLLRIVPACAAIIFLILSQSFDIISGTQIDALFSDNRSQICVLCIGFLNSNSKSSSSSNLSSYLSLIGFLIDLLFHFIIVTFFTRKFIDITNEYLSSSHQTTKAVSKSMARVTTPIITVSEFTRGGYNTTNTNNNNDFIGRETNIELLSDSGTTSTTTSYTYTTASDDSTLDTQDQRGFVKPRLATNNNEQSLGGDGSLRSNTSYRQAGLLTPGYITPKQEQLDQSNFNSNNNNSNNNINISTNTNTKTDTNGVVMASDIDIGGSKESHNSSNDKSPQSNIKNSISRYFHRSKTPDVAPLIENELSVANGVGVEVSRAVTEALEKELGIKKKSKKKKRKKKRKKLVDLNSAEREQWQNYAGLRNRRNVQIQRIIESLVHINAIIIYSQIIFYCLIAILLLSRNQLFSTIISITTTLNVFVIYLMFKKTVIKRRCACCFSSFFVCYRCCGVSSQLLIIRQ